KRRDQRSRPTTIGSAREDLFHLRLFVGGKRSEFETGVNVLDLADLAGADEHGGDLGTTQQPQRGELRERGAVRLGEFVEGLDLRQKGGRNLAGLEENARLHRPRILRDAVEVTIRQQALRERGKRNAAGADLC